MKDGYNNKDVYAPDFVKVLKMDWDAKSGTPHTDAFATKGIVLNLMGMASGAQDPKDFAKDQLLASMNDITVAHPDAKVGVSYFMHDAYTTIDVSLAS